MPPIVRTDRLELRPLRTADRDEFVRVYTVSSAHFAPWEPTTDVGLSPSELFEKHLAAVAASEADGSGWRRAAFLADGRLAALVSISMIFRGPFESCVCGWRVSADQINRGLGTEAVTALLDAAFVPRPRGLGLHRVQCGIVPENAPSLRLAEKAGFRRQGLALRYLSIAGRWRDHALLAKTVEEHRVRWTVLDAAAHREP